MKKLIPFLPLFLLAGNPLKAQTEGQEGKPKTQLSEVLIREGAIIAKKFEDVGSYTTKGLFFPGTGNLKVQFVTLQDAATNQITKGYLFSSTKMESSYLFQNFTAFIDYDEMPGLVKYLQFVNEKFTEQERNTEYWFNSKELSFIVFYRDTPNKNGENWAYTVEINRYTKDSTFFFSNLGDFFGVWGVNDKNFRG